MVSPFYVGAIAVAIAAADPAAYFGRSSSAILKRFSALT
jgi:hypothetical protein